MDRFSRIVLGYHGCAVAFAETLLRGELPIAQWQPSQNPYDWLGHGIYFWEHAPERAREWGEGGVIGAVIQLGRCLDLTDVRYMDLLASAYQATKKSYRQQKRKLPRNQAGRRELDCLIINTLVAAQDQVSRFQTVRGPFLEGRRVFPGSGIFRESHVQIAVRDLACILGVFRPNLS
jgi:hypothetical protein